MMDDARIQVVAQAIADYEGTRPRGTAKVREKDIWLAEAIVNRLNESTLEPNEEE